MSYIRVAVNVSDMYSKITEIYAVAFKTTAADRGPYGNGTDLNNENLENFINDNKDNQAYVIKRMFENSTDYPNTVDVAGNRNVIAYLDKVYSDIEGNISPVETDGQLYYVYIFARNSSDYVFIKPSEVEITNIEL